MSLQERPEAVPLADFYGSLEPIAGIGMWRFDFATQAFEWSRGLRLLLNLDNTGEPGFELFASLVHPADRLDGDCRQLFLSGRTAIDCEFRIIRRSGSLRWLSHKGQTFYDADMKPVFAAGIMRDITSRVEAIKARDLAEVRIAEVKRTALCFAWVTTADAKTPYSPGWSEITGQTAEQSADWGWLEQIHEADRERTRRAWLHSLEAKTSYAATYRLLCRDGIMRWFIARSEPVFDSSGKLVEWFGVAFDISDVKGVEDVFFSDSKTIAPTGTLVRTARALLDWSINELAKRSGVSISSIRRLESEASNGARDQTTDRLMKVLDRAGIEFRCVDGQGTFVRLRKDKNPPLGTGASYADARL
jgi:PAS domain S-box-containing protein